MKFTAHDSGGPVCWCSMTARTPSTDQGDHLNSRPSEAALAINLVETLRLAVPLHLAEIRALDLTDNQLLPSPRRHPPRHPRRDE